MKDIMRGKLREKTAYLLICSLYFKFFLRRL